MGVLFTNRPRADVEEFMKEFKQQDYARAGTIACKTVPLKVEYSALYRDTYA